MTATALSPSELAQSAGEAYHRALELTLQRAVNCHEADQLSDAEQLYRSVLQAQSEHPEANHNLGVLLLEMQKFEASLPYFEAALMAKPELGRYWLNYIDALILAGQTGLAQRTLAFGREHGLEGDAADALARILETGQKANKPAHAAQALHV